RGGNRGGHSLARSLRGGGIGIGGIHRVHVYRRSGGRTRTSGSAGVRSTRRDPHAALYGYASNRGRRAENVGAETHDGTRYAGRGWCGIRNGGRYSHRPNRDHTSDGGPTVRGVLAG